MKVVVWILDVQKVATNGLRNWGRTVDTLPVSSPCRNKKAGALRRPTSSDGLLDELFLQAADLLLEGLDLLPAVQRPSVVCPQTRHDGLLRLAHLGIHLLQLLPAGQLGSELLDLLGHAVPAHVLLPLLLIEGRFGGRRIRDLVDQRRLAGLVGLAGEGFAEFGKVLRLLLAQLLELGGQALLVLQLLLPRPRRVGLGGIASALASFLRFEVTWGIQKCSSVSTRRAH